MKPMEGTPASPSKMAAGILKTPGTITRRKSVTFNRQQKSPKIETPKVKRTSILSKNFPGKYPSPYTPRTRSPALSAETDLISASQSPIETISQHIDLVLENNARLQKFIRDKEYEKPYNPYSAHPDLDAMKQELEKEKALLKQFWAGFEQQQGKLREKEGELSLKYAALEQQMKEQYALQNSSAKIVEDYQVTIQQLNKAIGEQREGYESEISQVQREKADLERKVRGLVDQLDDAKDLLREQRAQVEEREVTIAEWQEKCKRAQRQLQQLKLETLEARVGPTMKEGESRALHKRSGGRRTASASATLARTTAEAFKPTEAVVREKENVEPMKGMHRWVLS
jgi:septal ring factor EnvC (AmiA/AmiB activator)